MLQMMRSGAHSKLLQTILFSLLLLGAVGMGLGLGVGDMFRGRVHSTTVASIDGEKISKSEFDGILEHALREQRMSQQDAYRQGLTEQELQREVNARLFTRAANDLGLYVDDGSVRKELETQLQPYLKAGLTKQQALDAALNRIGMTESRLVNSLKKQMAVEHLSHALADGAHAPQQLVDDIMKFRYEARRGEYFKLTAADAGVKEPANADLESFYKTMQSRFMQPELRSFAVLVLDPQTLGGKKTAGDAELKAYYDAHKDKFNQPERRVAEELSVPDEALANKLYAAAKKGQDLKAVAAAGGKDANVQSGTWSEQEFLPAEIAADVFKVKTAGLQPPRKSPLGWHIVRVEKILPPAKQSFEAAKDDIARTLAAAGGDASEAMYNRVNEIDDMAGSGKSLAEVAAQFKLQEVAFDKLDAQGRTADGKDADHKGVPALDRALAAVFKLDKGGVSQLIQAPGGYLLAETRDIVPAAAKPLSAVRAEVAQDWKDKQVADALADKAQKLLDQLKIGGSFAKVAESAGKQAQETALIHRNTPVRNDMIDPVLRVALFNLDKPGDATAVPGQGSVTILRLADRRIDLPKTPGKEDLLALQAMLSQDMQKDILEQFRRSLMARYDVKIDYDVLKEQYAPKPGDDEN